MKQDQLPKIGLAIIFLGVLYVCFTWHYLFVPLACFVIGAILIAKSKPGASQKSGISCSYKDDPSLSAAENIAARTRYYLNGYNEILKSQLRKPTTNFPMLITKSPKAAFEYICKYVSFDEDMVPGLVKSINKEGAYNRLEIIGFHDNKITNIGDNINFLGDNVKVGDLVVCLLIKIPDRDFVWKVTSYLLAPQFNPNTVAWKVAAQAAKDITIEEIPIVHLAVPRILNERTA